MARIDSSASLKIPSPEQFCRTEPVTGDLLDAQSQKNMSRHPASRFFVVSVRPFHRGPISASALSVAPSRYRSRRRFSIPKVTAAARAVWNQNSGGRTETARLFAGGVCHRADDDHLPVRK